MVKFDSSRRSAEQGSSTDGMKEKKGGEQISAEVNETDVSVTRQAVNNVFREMICHYFLCVPVPLPNWWPALHCYNCDTAAAAAAAAASEAVVRRW